MGLNSFFFGHGLILFCELSHTNILRESTPELCINFLAYCMEIKDLGNKKREKKPLKTGKLFSQILG